MKRLSMLAVPLLMIGLLAGCGDDSSSAASDEPTSPAASSSSAAAEGGGSVEAFCNVLIGILQQPPQGMSDKEALNLLKGIAAQLEQVGAPEDMPEDASRALQTAIDKISSLPADATQEEVSQAAADLTAEQKKDQQALGEYVQEKCMGGVPSAASSSAG